MLNRVSFIRSVVGLVSIPSTVFKSSRLALPAITLIPVTSELLFFILRP